MSAPVTAAPVGVFDSGIGGLSVLQAVREELPREPFIYLADQAAFPYGEQPPDAIVARSLACTRELLDAGCKLIVVACNTATTAAIDALRSEFPAVPFVGVVPALKPAVEATTSGTVAVCATRWTIASPSYQQLKARFGGDATVIDVACPGWVEMVERGTVDVAALLEPIAHVAASDADQLVLGCTHYPLLSEALRPLLPSHIQLHDSGTAVARQVRSVLEAGGLLSDGRGAVEYRSTSDDAALLEAAARWQRERTPA